VAASIQMPALLIGIGAERLLLANAVGCDPVAANTMLHQRLLHRFSAAGAQILKLFTHSDKFGDSVTFAAGSSNTEHGLTPKQPVTLSWATFTDAANQAGISRRYGGIHFELADLVGRAIGRLVADQAWKKAQGFIRGESEDEEESGEDRD